MYVGVPTIAPVSARLWSVRLNSVALATPKSMTLGVGRPSTSVTSTLRGLEVAVDDPLLVGVLHGLADRDEQLQPGPDREPVLVAIVGDRHAADELHHEERLVRLRGAAVVDAGDVGMVHQGQRLAFGVEPGQHRARVHAGLDQLERHLPLDRLRLLGPVDGAHAPLAEDFEQRVPAGDDLARDESAGAGRPAGRPRSWARAVRSGSPVRSSVAGGVSEARAAVPSWVSGAAGSNCR